MTEIKKIKTEINSYHKQLRIVKHLQGEINKTDKLYTEISTEKGFLYVPSNLALKILSETYKFYSLKIFLTKKQLINNQ